MVSQPDSSLHAMAELRGAHREAGEYFNLSPGIKYNLSESLFLALGVPLGLTGDEEDPDYQVIGQIQIAW